MLAKAIDRVFNNLLFRLRSKCLNLNNLPFLRVCLPPVFSALPTSVTSTLRNFRRQPPPLNVIMVDEYFNVVVRAHQLSALLPLYVNQFLLLAAATERTQLGIQRRIFGNKGEVYMQMMLN